jgi:peptidoglycan LD-endopeptidase LytH
MALRFADRLLTIVATATVTSAAWVVVGSLFVDLNGPGGREPTGGEAAGSGTESSKPVAAGERGLSVTLPSGSQLSQLVIPVLNVRADQLTNTFTDDREGGERLHEALDIPAPAGTSVMAAGPGTVERLFQSAAGGNTIYIRSNDRQTIHYYAHLRDYAPGLREGQVIRRGQRLGTVGSSGNADPAAPHLHFAILRITPDQEWWEPSTAINPYPLLTRR